jgi:hypothetical protein
MRISCSRGGGISCGRRRNWPLAGAMPFSIDLPRSGVNWLGVPPCWRAYFLLLRQKKVAKEKATPGSAPFGFLALLGGPGGLLNSPAAQTTQAEGPRPACVAQRLSWGPQRRPRSSVSAPKVHSHGQPEKKPKNEIPSRSTDASLLPLTGGGREGVWFPGPLEGAEQRRGWRKRGEDCLRAKPEFRSPRQSRVAQGTGAAGTDPGSPSSLATFFLAKQEESKTPRKGGTPG